MLTQRGGKQSLFACTTAKPRGNSARNSGTYFIYVSDLDRASRYQIEFNGISFYVLPINNTSVYNELVDDARPVANPDN